MDKLVFTYTNGSDGIIFKKVLRVHEDGSFEADDFDVAKHGELLAEWLGQNNITGKIAITDLEKIGIFEDNDLTNDKITEYVNNEDNSFKVAVDDKTAPSDDDSNPAPSDGDDDTVGKDDEDDPSITREPDKFTAEDEYNPEDDDVKNNNHFLLKAGAAGLGAAALLTLLHSCTQQDVDNEKEEITDIFSQMTPAQREFFEPSLKALENFNARTSEEGTFKLDSDTTQLTMTVDEMIALNIMLNNYTADELYEVFGTTGFDTTNVMDLARSAYSKLSVYYMNANKPSGLSEIIQDEEARAFFEKLENNVVEFNKTPSTELSDQVIKGLYYGYIAQGSTGEYARINNNGVAWLATSTGFGFELANRNVREYLKVNKVSDAEKQEYGKAVIPVGLSLNKITTSELLTGINEEVPVDVMDEINNKSLCAVVTAQTRDKIQSLGQKQQISVSLINELAKNDLAEGLKDIGLNTLANKVRTGDITEELLEEIRDTNARANSLVEDYQGSVNAIKEKEAKLNAILELAREQYNSKEITDISNLVNNRFRVANYKDKNNDKDTSKTPTSTNKDQDKNNTKVPVVGVTDDNKPIYDGEAFDKLPEKEQQDFIKDNGEVIDKNTTVIEKPITKDEMTQEEVEKVTKEEDILKEVDEVKAYLVTAGAYDANDYTEEVGAYKYSGEIVIELTGQKINTTNMTLAKIAQFAYAYDGVSISSDDAQIQARMNEDVKGIESKLNSLSDDAQEYLKNKYGSNWKETIINETYKSGYISSIQATLKEAYKQGEKLREDTKTKYEEALKKAEEMNKPSTDKQTESSTTQTPTTNETTNTPTDTDNYDPNLDPNFGAKDEIPYTPTDWESSKSESVKSEDTQVKPVDTNTTTPSDKQTESSTTQTPTTNETTNTPTDTDNYDPNLDSNFGAKDEIPLEQPLNWESSKSESVKSGDIPAKPIDTLTEVSTVTLTTTTPEITNTDENRFNLDINSVIGNTNTTNSTDKQTENSVAQTPSTDKSTESGTIQSNTTNEVLTTDTSINVPTTNTTNEVSTNTASTDATTNTTTYNSNYDPNLDLNYAMGDEIPLEMPLDWDNAYSSSVKSMGSRG